MTEPEYEAVVSFDGNREAELAVLAGSFRSPVIWKQIRATMTGADLMWPHHEAIWDAMVRLTDTGEPIGHTTLIEILKTNRMAIEALPNLITTNTVEGEAIAAASIVHDLATKRRLVATLTSAMSQATSPHADSLGLAAKLVTQITELRDSGTASANASPITVQELLETEDEPYDWAIPNLLERGDRFMLTGEEGMGKSVLLRQIALCGAAGLDPFGNGRIEPVNALIIDAENTQRQNRRALRGLATAIADRGSRDPRQHTRIEHVGRIDITRDMVLSRIHQMLDAAQPDILVIGPLYRLTFGAIQTDDEAAPLLAALDTIKDRGIAILIEAHAGHARATGTMRPRGSAAFLGWPEFGYGLRLSDEFEHEFKLERWRGDRDERAWPHSLERGGVLPWSASERQKVDWAVEVDKQRRFINSVNTTNPYEPNYTP